MKKNLQMGGILAGAVVALLLALGGYRYIRHKQQLQAEQIQVMKQEQEIIILKSMMNGGEQERSRIARELHDGIGGMVSAAIMRSLFIRQHHEELARIAPFKEIVDILGDISKDVRNTAHNLMPEVLLRQNLPEAVRSFCEQVQGDTLDIEVSAYGELDVLPYEFKLSIYRIIQELLKNIIQHAEATHVLVQMVLHEHALNITVEDNGKGFDMDKIRNGMGLHNLEVRVRSLKGRLTLESKEMEGTSVFVEFRV